MRGLIQQVVVFGAIFLALQLGFEWLRGTPITAGVFQQLFIISVVVAVMYGGFVWLLKKRNNRRD